MAKDICNILGYANPSNIVKKFCRKAGISNRYIQSLSNTYTLIDEGNLYRIIIKSNKSEAERFESWVCDEVLPSIRKTGKYESGTSRQSTAPEISVTAKAMISMAKAFGFKGNSDTRKRSNLFKSNTYKRYAQH